MPASPSACGFLGLPLSTQRPYFTCASCLKSFLEKLYRKPAWQPFRFPGSRNRKWEELTQDCQLCQECTLKETVKMLKGQPSVITSFHETEGGRELGSAT